MEAAVFPPHYKHIKDKSSAKNYEKMGYKLVMGLKVYLITSVEPFRNDPSILANARLTGIPKDVVPYVRGRSCITPLGLL